MYGDLLNDRFLAILLVTAQIFIAYLAVMWLALAYWTYRDIKRRTNDVVVQAMSVALAVFFFLPGYWVYLVLRPGQTIAEREEERLRAALISEYAVTSLCPYCRDRVQDDFILCPNCHFALKEACKGCSHALQPMWSVCPFCGKTRTESSKSQPADSRESQPVEIGSQSGFPVAVGK